MGLKVERQDVKDTIKYCYIVFPKLKIVFKETVYFLNVSVKEA